MVRETDSGTSFAVSRATRPLAGVALLFAAVVGANAPAAADTIDICRKADGETSQAACSEAIASGKFQGRELAASYLNRGLVASDTMTLTRRSSITAKLSG